MKRIFQIYSMIFLFNIAGGLIGVLIDIAFGAMLHLNVRTLSAGIGIALLFAAFPTALVSLPECTKKAKQMLNAKTQKDLEKYRTLRSISQETKHNHKPED